MDCIFRVAQEHNPDSCEAVVHDINRQIGFLVENWQEQEELAVQPEKKKPQSLSDWMETKETFNFDGWFEPRHYTNRYVYDTDYTIHWDT